MPCSRVGTPGNGFRSIGKNPTSTERFDSDLLTALHDATRSVTEPHHHACGVQHATRRAQGPAAVWHRPDANVGCRLIAGTQPVVDSRRIACSCGILPVMLKVAAATKINCWKFAGEEVLAP